MSRVAGKFASMAQQGRKVLIPYIVAGDPDLEATVPLMHALVAAGADILEVGVPFSDPMAEGPVIQLAHERALERETSLAGVLNLVTQFRQDDANTPVVLMGYANPIERMGYAHFAQAASTAGVDALITVDIPPEEVECMSAALKDAEMDAIFLVAPTTPDARIATITDQASGFIYYVSLKGVTGAGHLDTEDVAAHVSAIRRHSDLPVAVGFGIKDAASASAVAAVADGVVVGSALVHSVAQAIADGGSMEQGIAAAGTLLAQIRTGIDTTAS